MATTTTTFSNTQIAQNDSIGASLTGLTEDSVRLSNDIVYLDVLANDRIGSLRTYP